MAEDAAAAHLEAAGLTVVQRNVRSREGEIDLVCRDGSAWVFVEVKSRQASWGDAPAAAVSWHKRRRITRVAQYFLKRHGLGEPRCRFDVVSVTLERDGATSVRHIRDAFDASDW